MLDKSIINGYNKIEHTFKSIMIYVKWIKRKPSAIKVLVTLKAKGLWYAV